MQVPCFECALRACGLFKPITRKRIERHQRDQARSSRVAGRLRDHPRRRRLPRTLHAVFRLGVPLQNAARRPAPDFELPAAGRLVGLQAAMFDAAQHGIEALTEVQLCLLPRRKVWALFGIMPGLAFDVAWLGSREESYVDENLTSVGRRSAAERIAALIVMLYKRARRSGSSPTKRSCFRSPSSTSPTRLDCRSCIPTRRWHVFAAWVCSRDERLADFDQSARAGEVGQYFDEEIAQRPLI